LPFLGCRGYVSQGCQVIVIANVYSYLIIIDLFHTWLIADALAIFFINDALSLQ
jgi:hypothetical protein